MKYKYLANKFLNEQEDEGFSFAGIPAIAVNKFAEWLDVSEKEEQSPVSPIRILNSICYGTTIAVFLWLLFW